MTVKDTLRQHRHTIIFAAMAAGILGSYYTEAEWLGDYTKEILAGLVLFGGYVFYQFFYSAKPAKKPIPQPLPVPQPTPEPRITEQQISKTSAFQKFQERVEEAKKDEASHKQSETMPQMQHAEKPESIPGQQDLQEMQQD